MLVINKPASEKMHNQSLLISITTETLTIFIIYICLKQNYIKQYKSLQTNTLFSGYRILKLIGFAKKCAIQDF